jgi:hypothetical protein
MSAARLIVWGRSLRRRRVVATRPPLTPKSAQITTAAVAIKALTVNGKQVTLAVFRQLYNEPLYDRLTWEAAGTPWCRVNYHPDKCERDTIAHEHVVWQKGEELRRARVDRPKGTLASVPRFDGRHDDEAAICLAAGSISNAQITAVKSRDYISSRSVTGDAEVHIAAEWKDSAAEAERTVEAKLYLSDHSLANLVRPLGNQPHSSLHTEHNRIHPDHAGCTRVATILGQRLVQHSEWLDKAQGRWEETQALDQVFIAL